MRFFRLTMMLWLFITAMVGCTVLCTNSEPGELQALGFSICDGRPCFTGISPGETTWQNARDTLEKNGAQRTNMEGEYVKDRLHINIYYPPETPIVALLDVMDVSGTSFPMTIGDAVRYWGFPCGFNPDPYPASLNVIYPHVYVTVSLADQRISPVTPIR